jgi:uncharacterized protein YdaU (DUF1376 family)
MEIALHYYQFNIGDYRRDTQHLGLLEHGIYRQLIDTYYLNGGPLKADHDQLMRTHCIRSANEKQAYENIIKDFFETQDGLLIHRGCDKVITTFRKKSKSASDSANQRWEQFHANALQTQSEGNANHKPITNNQEPIINTTRQKAISCPQGVSEDVWRDFCQHRKSVRATVTQTALDGIDREAKKAGWSLEAALRECVLRGWRGFKAEWVKDKQSDKVLSFAEKDELAKRKRWEEMTGRKWPEPGEKVERLQIL